jgi:hypothetical protein
MKLFVQIAAGVIFVATMTGCTSTKAYFVDRGRDAADILTVTAGTGVGASVRTGPVHCGLFYGRDRIGLRGGESRWVWTLKKSEPWQGPELWAMMIDPLLVYPAPDDINLTGFDIFQGERETNTISRMRGKWYEVEGVCPFVMMPVTNNYAFTGSQYPHSYLTQIELSAGLGITLRLGFNPGELLDFLLGWFGIDIFADDIEMKKLRGTLGYIRPE